MSKYDEGFKLMVVNAYLAGEGGYLSLSKKFGVKSKTNIEKWVHTFKAFVKEGLENKKIITFTLFNLS